MPAHKTHGLTGQPLFNVWRSMVARCCNAKDKRYHRYGGRGIGICSEWRSPNAFLEWAKASGYRSGLTLERVDNDGDYSPHNCTWIPMADQQRNTSASLRITALGKTMLPNEWARETGLRARTILSRLRLGWSDLEAISTPARPMRRNS